MTKVHEQYHGDEAPPKHPEPGLENYHTEDSYPMQHTDIEELMDLHGGYSTKMAFSYHISKHSASSYGSLIDISWLSRRKCPDSREDSENSLCHWY